MLFVNALLHRGYNNNNICSFQTEMDASSTPILHERERQMHGQDWAYAQSYAIKSCTVISRDGSFAIKLNHIFHLSYSKEIVFQVKSSSIF